MCGADFIEVTTRACELVRKTPSSTLMAYHVMSLILKLNLNPNLFNLYSQPSYIHSFWNIMP